MVLAGVIGLLCIGLHSFVLAHPAPPAPLFPYVSSHIFEVDAQGVDSRVALVSDKKMFYDTVLKGSGLTVVKLYTHRSCDSSAHEAWFQKTADLYAYRVRCCAINLAHSRGLLPCLVGLAAQVHSALCQQGGSTRLPLQAARDMIASLKLCARKSYGDVKPFYLLFSKGQLIVPGVFGPDSNNASLQLLEKYAHQGAHKDTSVLAGEVSHNFLDRSLDQVIVGSECAPKGSFLHAHTIMMPQERKKLGLL